MKANRGPIRTGMGARRRRPYPSMKRDRALIPLSQQHHNGLALCVLTDRELADDASEPARRRLARRIVDRWDIELVNHFELEEQLLFPACPPVLAPLVEELVAEHREIERLTARLRSEASGELLREFTGLLRHHIRREEDELFERAQQLIPRAMLDKIGGEIDSKAVRVCL